MDHSLKRNLLEEYAEKEPKKFFQIDVWKQDGPDCVFTPDENGLVMSSGIVHELRRSDFPLRVHIHESADLNDVLNGLDRVKESIQHYADNPGRMFQEYEPGDTPF